MAYGNITGAVFMYIKGVPAYRGVKCTVPAKRHGIDPYRGIVYTGGV
jgi:hypothetical protein